MGRNVLPALGALALAAIGSAPAAVQADSNAPRFSAPYKLDKSDGDTEPRITVAPDGTRFIISNSGGTAVVYASTDGLSWKQTAGDPAAQAMPSIDTDIVSTRTGRIIADELDFGGINFRTSFSDDAGKTWTAVAGPAGLPTPFTGTGYADQDRPWLAVGPDDPGTKMPRVYMLMHNLASGTATHNMWVATSTDNGASFGPFIPVTLPGEQAWTDLQCADSGGPTNLFVNQRDGRVFAVYGTRSSAVGGGCGASVTGSFEINVVAATRVWIATAPASGTTDPMQWTQSLAVDDNATGQIVGMQLAPGAIDAAQEIYVVYPESPKPYPDYTGAAIKFVHALASDVVANPYGASGPARNVWSHAVTVAPAVQPGNLLPHVVAGDPGKLDIAWFAGSSVKDPSRHCGVTVEGKKTDPPCWYPTAAQVTDATANAPTITMVRLSDFPAYANADASAMMGACNTTPPASYGNGFACTRSTDVWGVAIDHAGNFEVVWPGDGGEFNTPYSGTYVSTQVAGATITGGAAPAPAPPSVIQAAESGPGIPNTSGSPAVPLTGLLLLVSALFLGTRALRRSG